MWRLVRRQDDTDVCKPNAKWEAVVQGNWPVYEPDWSGKHSSIKRWKAAKVQIYEILDVRSPMWLATFNYWERGYRQSALPELEYPNNKSLNKSLMTSGFNMTDIQPICYWALIPSIGHEKNLCQQAFGKLCARIMAEIILRARTVKVKALSLCPNMHYSSEEDEDFRLRTVWHRRGYRPCWPSFVHATEQPIGFFVRINID